VAEMCEDYVASSALAENELRIAIYRSEAVKAEREKTIALNKLIYRAAQDFANANGTVPDWWIEGLRSKVIDKSSILSATDPVTVELPKCDHCGTSCGTDCDGSSHYTPDCHP